MWIHILVWCALAAGAWVMRKKRTKLAAAMLLLIAAGNLAGNILSFAEYREGRQEEEQVVRGEDQDTQRTEQFYVSVEGEAGERKVRLTIPNRVYSEEESEELLIAAMEELDSVILGENPSFTSISKKMNLVTSLPDSPVKIQWNTSEPTILDWEGNPGESIPEHGSEVILEAVLKLGAQTKEYVRLIEVYPGEISADEQFEREMQEAVEADNTDPQYVTLPKFWDGKKLSWRTKEEHTGILILALSAVGAVLLGMKKKQDEVLAREEREEQLALDYPELVSKMILLLGAGLNTRRMFERIAADYCREQKEGGHKKRYAYEEALHTYYEMEGGVSEAEAYENFGERCAVSSYRALSVLLVQNLKKGNSYLLPLLEKEAADAFEDRKRAAKIAGEKASTKLLLPMVMTLGVVLTIIMIPAFVSFY